MAELEKYNQKRDFKKTAEPEGKVKGSSGKVIFMIQKHEASRLHFDFRIEVDGVLKSWAVPKGPPLKSSDRHLAMMVEDHPYDYRTFEGTIPKGEYGGGTVMLWDEGTYYVPQKPSDGKTLEWSEEVEKDPKKIQEHVNEMIKKGSIKLFLEGKKIKGKYALVKFKRAGENAWLMIKDKDEFEGRSIENADLSVKTGRTMNEIAKGEKGKKKVYFKLVNTNSSENLNKTQDIDTNPVKLSKQVSPMLATLIDQPFDNNDWIFEIKWDGYRAIANINSSVELISRNNQLLNKDYLLIINDLKKLNKKMVLDGEITVIDEYGKSDFQYLQNYKRFEEGKLIYYVFDILELEGKDLRGLSLTERKFLLKKAFKESNHVQLSDYIESQGNDFFKLAKQKGLEGIIAKRKDSIYEDGIRSNHWLKIKIVHQQEVVIGGYTYPDGTRKAFGSLLIGVFKNGEFKYVGHTGSGFNDNDLLKIKDKLDKFKVNESPFEDNPRMNNVAAWIKPEVVCQVKFHGWTDGGLMRQAIFLGLRSDKPAENIKREEPKNLNRKKLKLITIKQNEFTNQSKIFWPKEKYTKQDLINYYSDISDFILPYLINRPQNLNRFPNGITGKNFYQKDFKYDPPDFAATIKIESESTHKETNYLICNNKDTLLYMANLGCIEINPWNSKVDSLDYPDYLIFDLDANPKYFKNLIKTAIELHKLLDKLELPNFCKTSGKRGMHVHVPLGAKYNFEQIRTFAEIISIKIQNKLPELISLERDPDLRTDKVYIDYLQNRKGQTTASVYSLRPVDGAPASTPVKWSEVNLKLDPKDFSIKNIRKRLDKFGDLWSKVLSDGINLTNSLKILDSLS